MKNILSKLDYLHQSFGIAHLNLSSSNIYLNFLTFEIFLGPIKLVHNVTEELWYSSPEISLGCPSHLMQFGIKNDVWTVGCLIAEMFFVATPLFQSYGTKDKLRRIIEILGFPKYSDVSYLSVKEYNSLYQKYANNIKQTTPYLDQLVDVNVDDSFSKEIFSIMESCLQLSHKSRPGINELITRVVNAIKPNVNKKISKEATQVDYPTYYETKSFRGTTNLRKIKEETEAFHPPIRSNSTYSKDEQNDEYRSLNESKKRILNFRIG